MPKNQKVKDDFDEEDSEEELDEEVDSDALRPAEEGVIEGFEGKEDVKCAYCNKVLGDEDEVVEEEFDSKVRRFCSNRCAEGFASGKKKKKIKK